MADVRPELPEMPARIAFLPVHRGYPVPWFVAWLDDAGDETRPGVGTPDFRVLRSGAVAAAYNGARCWICGDRLGVYRAFVLGPMCAVNRTSVEPPSHVDCAEWSARACPFLTRPHMERREGGLPADAVEPAGTMIRRNPGVALVWVARGYYPWRTPDGGILFHIGEPGRVAWFAEGRDATRDEVDASIASGMDALYESAAAQGQEAVARLKRELEAVMALLPDAVPEPTVTPEPDYEEAPR